MVWNYILLSTTKQSIEGIQLQQNQVLAFQLQDYHNMIHGLHILSHIQILCVVHISIPINQITEGDFNPFEPTFLFL